MLPGVLGAILAAIAFGASTPFVQYFGRDAGPFWTAALLYAGAALGGPSSSPGREAPLRRSDAPRLLAVAACGAFVAPVVLAWGLRRTGAASASLMLNSEAFVTVALGKLVYGEHLGRRVLVAALLIAVGGGILVVSRGAPGSSDALGLVAVALATLGWALDNTLARPLADRDPGAVVRAKGVVGAAFSVTLALASHDTAPVWRDGLGLMVCGLIGFGLSLRLYLLAQRRLGAARTASVFAVAPFVGALVAVGIGRAEHLSWPIAGAAALMGLGVWLHASERHAHAHAHEPVEHEHAHRHDDGHHDHVHEPMPAPGTEHSHPHTHDARVHTHDHAEDAHHRHHRHP